MPKRTRKKTIGKNPTASEMGRKGGPKGAATLNASLTPEERSASARRAAKARWAKKKAKPQKTPAI